MADKISAKNARLLRKWDKRIKMTESVLGKKLGTEKAVALAVCLENTHHRIKMTESTQPAGIGQYKRYALDIVNAVVPNLIAYDICSVQPIDNRVGMINYIQYDYGSNKGKTKAGDMFASSLNMGVADPNYSTSAIDGEMIAAAGTTSISATASWTPIIPGTFGVNVDGTVITDDGAGNITGTGVTGTIDYATGTLAITLTNAPTQDVTASYTYNNEDVPINNVPEVNLKITSLPVQAQSRKMKAVYAFDAAYELEKEYGQDIDSLLATEVSGEIAHEIDIELAKDIRDKAATENTPWSKTQITGVNLVDHYDSFYARIVEGLNLVYQSTRKIKPNFMVCGLNVASVIEVMRNFSPSGQQASGPYFMGTLGNIKVYVSPEYDPDEYVMGYKGSSFMDAGMFYCPYMPIISTDLLMTDDFAGRKGWATMYAKKMVNNKMYIRGKITD